MRTLVLFLLLANLSLFGYVELDRRSAGEGVRLQQQLQPEKLRLLTPQQVAALGPEKKDSLADVCAEWGPFDETERARALADLEPLGLGRLVSSRRADPVTSYWTYIAPLTSRRSAERRVDDLRDMGISDVSIVEYGERRLAISLGVFRSEEAAADLAADLVKRGVANVRSGPRPKGPPMTAVVIRDPPANAIARLKDLQPGYPKAEVRIGNCDRSP
ncbi:MAG: SPOR domain-containing protein [Pseudomonadota bacterium]|nr:SPOR domain-containing protein [Pseudomonadota bacterium]